MAFYNTADVRPRPQKQMTTPSNTPHIRGATAGDAARMRAIAHAAYAKYVPRIGREPSPMAADYEAAVTANRAVVIEAAGSVRGSPVVRISAWMPASRAAASRLFV